MAKKCWQTIGFCVVLAGASGCGGAAVDSQDPSPAPAGAAGTGSGEIPEGGNPSEWPNGDAGRVSEPRVEDELKPGECGASSFEAEQIAVEREVVVESQVTTAKPVALYVMFDKSMSMGPPTGWYPNGKSLWEPAVHAMKSFLTDEKSKDIGVAIQYFPRNGGSCATGAGYSTPAVNVGLLPEHASTIATSLDDANPDGLGTPIEGALRGVTAFCVQYQSEHADEQCIAVLVTDGKPEFDNCQKNHDALAKIAEDAAKAGVTTFAVGLQGADFALLDKIAKAGGAPDCDTNANTHACDVSSGANKLVDALGKIRDTVVRTETHTVVETHVERTTLPCEWAIPEQPQGRVFDRDQVNIRLTTDGEETTLLRVPSLAACNGNAWHFDDSDAPTRLVACPQTCKNIESKPEGKIEILMGCATLTPQ